MDMQEFLRYVSSKPFTYMNQSSYSWVMWLFSEKPLYWFPYWLQQFVPSLEIYKAFPQLC